VEFMKCGGHLARMAALMLAFVAGCSRDNQRIAGDTVAAVNVAATPKPASADSTVTVYKSPACGCCKSWVDHLRQTGFRVVAIDTNDLDAVKARHGVPNGLTSCHTGLVAGYVVEGHVPAEDVRRLLSQRPAIVGLAVPGMPVGSPGMEGAFKQRYDVLAFTRDGRSTVFASH
jgi:hypothetical protein